jgi:uncharacterized protein YecA (UPF0149 family)
MAIAYGPAMKDRDGFRELPTEHGCRFVHLSAQDPQGVGRNDKCPCNSGKKYKNCHQQQVEASYRV